MKTVLHKAATRGHASHGWLNSWHSFSFAGYYDADRIHFGALRVLNDDTVEGGRGFGRHPHDNMEIISIPLEGSLEHEDSLGNRQVIRRGDIQIMSAGKGIAHSEKNGHEDQPVKFLQIWVFPNTRDGAPRYDQVTLSDAEKKNQLATIVSPMGRDGGVGIQQDAWFSIGRLDKDRELTYTLKKKGNGVYAFLLEGSLYLNEQLLNKRDGLGISDVDSFTLKAASEAEILLMEVPMEF